MNTYLRKRRTLRLPITLSVVLIVLNVLLMVCWIVLLAQQGSWSFLTVGTFLFALILIGLLLYLVVTIKEVRVNQRQANFVDAVTHELKSPIAALRLYLETLQMRELARDQQVEFFGVMETELERLDHLIDQLLEVGRLDAIGQQHDAEDIPMESLLRRCARNAAIGHDFVVEDVFEFDVQPTIVHARRIVLEMIFGNVLDNAVKYAGTPPTALVRCRGISGDRVRVVIRDNGEGVPRRIRRKIFRIFYRGGSELERRRKGTGLGLYIVRSLVHLLKGTVEMREREDGRPGSDFIVELPGRTQS